VISLIFEGVVGIRLGVLSQVGESSFESLDLMPTPEMQLIGSILISVITSPVSLTRRIEKYRRYIESGRFLPGKNRCGRAFSIPQNRHTPGDRHCSDS
jgi:hypothetical protein